MIGKHYHEMTIDSTQEFAMEKFKLGERNFIVSCFEQKKGKGRNEKIWEQNPVSTLCFSFATHCHEIKTLSSLEMGILIIKFFELNKNKFKFQNPMGLKWPNDILNRNNLKKIGGILINSFDESRMIVGIGINLYPEKISEEFSYLLEEKTLLNNEEAKRWAFELYHYISNNRLTTEEIKKNFLQHCVHLNQKIHFAVGDQRKSGLFTGIGEVGEALILDIESQQIVKLFAGSLIIS